MDKLANYRRLGLFQANKLGFSSASSDVMMFVMSETSPQKRGSKDRNATWKGAWKLLAFLESLSKHRNSMQT